MTSLSYYVYGMPPAALAPVPEQAVQCSPLVPGAVDLANLPAARADGAVVYAPPSTAERGRVFAEILRALKPGAGLIALAPKDKGGARIARELEAFGCAVTETSKQHHRIVTVACPEMLQGMEEALVIGSVQRHAAHGLWTQPGIFSWDRLDPGSELLLQHLPELQGNGADFGCGLGVLSPAVLRSNLVTSLLLADIDRRAIACARRNITDSRAQFAWTDVRSALPVKERSLDFVVMNPPFHASGVEDHTIGQWFIRRAAEALRAGGVCWLTANRHLPYEQVLQQFFADCTLVAEAHGFKIYQAVK